MGIFEKDRDLTEAPTDARFTVDASTFRVKAKGFAMRLDHFLSHHLKWRSRRRRSERFSCQVLAFARRKMPL